MSYGYNGKIVRIDLTNRVISTEEPDANFYRKFLGGSGFVSYYLLKELKPKVDPLGPENKLIFATGVVTGAPISGSGRNSVGAKSPLTGGYGTAEAGGFWGVELKRSGFDVVIVEGKADVPVYLWIHDGEVEIRKAKDLWGMDIGESQGIIRTRLGDKSIRTTQIGLGGEKLVRYACIINDLRHVAGRCGLGAVMGSKRLKAIAVRGHDGPEVSDAHKLTELNRWLADNITLIKNLHELGTGGMVEMYAASGNLPTNNFKNGGFQKSKFISAQALKENHRVEMETCYACLVRCKKVVHVLDHWLVNPMYGGPEYETLAALGSNCGIDALEAICKANELCGRYTLDTISTGATIAFAMECFENGLITKDDTDGIELKFGNADAMVKIVEMIAKREGIGHLLGEGSLRASKNIGARAEGFAIHVKGQEIPMHEPRLQNALGLGYAVSPTGADHQHNMHDPLSPMDFWNMKALGILEMVDSSDFGPKKVRLFIYYVNWRVLNNCIGMCNFVPWDCFQRTEIVRAVTGWNSTSIELTKAAERTTNMARVFNLREGFTEKDDWLPDRFFQPQIDGPLSVGVDPQQLEKARRIYYGMMGWDENGIPSRDKLLELDISWVADELDKNNS